MPEMQCIHIRSLDWYLLICSLARQSSTMMHPTRSMSSIRTGASRNTSSMTLGVRLCPPMMKAMMNLGNRYDPILMYDTDAKTARIQAEDPPKYVTLKAGVQQIVFMREESEEDLGLQVALSIDAMTSMTRVHRNQKKKEDMEQETIEFNNENFIFHMNGSPVGTLLLVKLLGVRRSEPIELGTALFDLSDIVVGGPSAQITCMLEGKAREVQPTITLHLKLCSRRKSFTFSYLREEPLFHSSGYTITAEGLSQFPTPYRKAGMPFDEKLGRRLKFSDLHHVGKCGWADEVEGLEFLRSIDGRGGTYTIKKFSIMRTECRDLLISSLDGMLDGLHGTTFKLCDAFLVGAEVCVVMDEMGGIYVQDSLRMNGGCPEMVASIILRQILIAVQYLHEVKSRLHLDIDARNILCMKSGECRLGGFCYSVKHIGKTSKFSGPFCHMSPERLLGLECSFAADVWSIGILAMDLALGHCPYDVAKFEGPDGLFEFRKMVTSEESPSLKGVKGVSGTPDDAIARVVATERLWLCSGAGNGKSF